MTVDRDRGGLLRPPILLDLPAYLAAASTSMKRLFAYRVANWAGLFTNTWFLLFRVFALAAFYAGRTDAVAELTVHEGVAYMALTQALLMVIPQWGKFGLGESVRTGQIAIDLLRPIDYYGLHMSQRMGEAAYYVFLRAVPIAILSGAVGFLVPPAGALPLLGFLASVALGSWIAHSLFFIAEATSFWLETDTGPRHLLMAGQALFGGLILPLTFFPPGMRAVSDWLPFSCTLYAPVAIFLGKESLVLVARQLGWAVLLAAVARAVLAGGARRVVAHGG